MIVIDATDLVIGRLATRAAKWALEGEQVAVVNTEKAVVTGTRKNLFNEFLTRRQLGDAIKGPYYPKRPDLIVRRTIKRMLPFNQYRGKIAFKKIMCYLGIPTKLDGQKLETIEDASVSKLQMGKYLRLGEISQRLGWQKK